VFNTVLIQEEGGSELPASARGGHQVERLPGTAAVEHSVEPKSRAAERLCAASTASCPMARDAPTHFGVGSFEAAINSNTIWLVVCAHCCRPQFPRVDRTIERTQIAIVKRGRRRDLQLLVGTADK
jgi:hypothetical protein